MDDVSKGYRWWTSDEFKNDNKPASKAAWDECKRLAVEQLSNKKLYVMDVFCGTNHDSRMAIRFIMEVALQAHFVKNMFIAPSAEELEDFEPDFISYNAAKARGGELQGLGLNSGTAAIFNLTERERVIPECLVRRRDEEGYVLHDELLPCPSTAWPPCTAPPTPT